MIELVAFSIFIISFFVLVFNNFRLNLRLSELRLELIKAHLDKTIISEKLIKMVEAKNKTEDSSSEAFLKFLSDSRDWAYQYIEDVQAELDKFITDIEPEISYFKEYGDVGSMAPNYYSMKKISTAYDELKKLLPEDYDKIE
jgi:hypothetical protein